MLSYPGDWEIVTVKEVADINTGRRNTQDNKPNGRYKFFVRSPIVERIDVADYDCEAVLTAGDGNAGKVFHYVNGKFSAHQRVYIINNFRNISGRFFYYYFSRYFIDEVRKYTAKSTVDSVRRHMIADMLIPLPSLKEQTAIANTLSAFDTHITNLTELITKKKAIRDGALDDLMTGRTRLKGFCGDWEIILLGSKCAITSSKRVFEAEWENSGIPFLRTRDIANFHAGIEQKNKLFISEDTYRKKIAVSGEVKKDDLLVTGVGTIGLPFLVETDERLYFKDGNIIWVKQSKDINPKFLYYLFLSKNIQAQIASACDFTTVGTFTIKNAKKILISLPPLDEQTAIADTLTALDTEILSLETERAKISQIRDGATNELLTGKVRLIDTD